MRVFTGVRFGLVLALFSLGLASGCGRKASDGETGPTQNGRVASAFRAAASKYGIPARMMMAVAFKESHLSPRPESAMYVSGENPLGIPLSETAFGLSRAKIGLPNDDSSHNLETQIDAYARWIKKNLEDKHLTLNPNPSRPEEKFDWIWQLALMHRDGLDARRNVQIVFATELIEKLNTGDLWQDASSGEILDFPRENQPIKISEFPSQIQATLNLMTDESDVFAAQYFELTYQQPEENFNRPTHIRVVHCPLSLSACLELQNPTTDQDALRLQAHYIIPQDQSVVSKPLQVAQHKTPLLLTNNQGEPERVDNAIIVMLVGDSGRYEEGKRVQANPRWYTKYQLEKMGSIIRNVCPLLPKINPDIDVTRCMTPGVADGVNFKNQGNSETYQWGDIPDYDTTIFWSYIDAPAALNGEATFEFAGGRKVFDARSPVRFNLRFIRGAAKIVLERLERCNNNRLVWTTAQSELVRNVDRKGYEMNLFHRGPNSNGQHFFRALVYSNEGRLMGWAVDDLFLQNYDAEPGPVLDPKTCNQ